MKILVTGSRGFVGKNFVENLKNIHDGKDRTRSWLSVTEIYEYDTETGQDVLQEACRTCDFVFHFAGVNRPKDSSEFMKQNLGVGSDLLDELKRQKNSCPVMFASSVQASLAGRFSGSEYGKSKLAAEELLFGYAADTGAKALVYRFPNLFGKWCRPNYNSAVATFCHAVANGLPYTVNDRATELELVYIDDLINEMLDALEGKEHRCAYRGEEKVLDAKGRFCHVPLSYRATLGEIVDLLQSFHAMPDTLVMPDTAPDSFAKKLYSTYLSYLPASAVSYDLDMKVDNRGVFTELIKTQRCGQVSVNIARPGSVRGQHWHNSKWEIFIVVSGHGLIEERRIGMDPETGKEYPLHSFEVRGEQMRAVQMLPGYTHSIRNLSETENLVTVMWANEPFDESHPDTFYEAVRKEEEVESQTGVKQG